MNKDSGNYRDKLAKLANDLAGVPGKDMEQMVELRSIYSELAKIDELAGIRTELERLYCLLDGRLRYE